MVQVTFLNESHSAGYIKSRYIRHVGRLLGVAIADRCPLPWQTVRDKEGLRFEVSSRPDDVILAGETPRHVIPLPMVNPAKVRNQGSEDDELSGSQYQVGFLITCIEFSIHMLVSYLIVTLTTRMLQHSPHKRDYQLANALRRQW